MIHKTKNTHHKIILIGCICATIAIALWQPAWVSSAVANADYALLLNILLYLPAFFIFMGLIELWLPQKFIIRHLGKHTGVKGSIYSFMLGSLMPGPLYFAFPIASVIRKKGVSMRNISLFVCAWSSFKIGEEIFELQFLGLKFLLLRVVLTIPFVIIISLIIDRLHVDLKES